MILHDRCPCSLLARLSGLIVMLSVLSNEDNGTVFGLVSISIASRFALLATAVSHVLIKVRTIPLRFNFEVFFLSSDWFAPSLIISFFRFSGFRRLDVMSDNKVVGIMILIISILWTLNATAAVLLTIKVGRWLVSLLISLEFLLL